MQIECNFLSNYCLKLFEGRGVSSVSLLETNKNQKNCWLMEILLIVFWQTWCNIYEEISSNVIFFGFELEFVVVAVVRVIFKGKYDMKDWKSQSWCIFVWKMMTHFVQKVKRSVTLDGHHTWEKQVVWSQASHETAWYECIENIFSSHKSSMLIIHQLTYLVDLCCVFNNHKYNVGALRETWSK
jgi:hypothetical protein